MNDYKNILVIRTDRIGDMVLTVPALRALKKAYPSSRLTVLSAMNTRSLIEGLPFVDEVMVDDVSRGWIAYMKLVKELRRRRFDLAIVYHTKRRTNSACFLAGIPCRLGYRNEKLGFLLNRPVRDERHLGLKHEVEYCLDLLREIGVHSHDLRIEIACDKDAEVWAENFMRTHFPEGNVMVLHPDASCPTRRWPAENFARLGELLNDKFKAQIVIVGAEGGRSIAQDIMRRMRTSAVDLTGQLSLAQLASFLKRVNLLVSSDTGPIHVAAAVRTPLVCLFLRTQAGLNPERWHPLGDRCIVLVNKPGEEIVVDKNSRVISGSFGSTTPLEVLDAASLLLKR
jgi:lipopolysaccharide heptosyltransferase II